MEKSVVKLNQNTFPVLFNLAIENGWKGNFKLKHLGSYDHAYLILKQGKILAYTQSRGHATTYYKVVSLEEAIELITSKEESFKEGEWIIKGHWLLRIDRIYNNHYAGPGVNGAKWQLEIVANKPIKGWRKATDKEIEEALIKEAKRRGFKEGVLIKSFTSNPTCRLDSGSDFTIGYENYNGGDKYVLRFQGACIYSNGKWAEIVEEPKEIFGHKVTKLQNGDYKFGCEDHVYSQSELKRIVNTLGNLKGIIHIFDLYEELKRLIRE